MKIMGELESLQFHWGSAYRITHPRPGTWLAQRRDDRATLRAATPDELLKALRQDYAARPVPRCGQRPGNHEERLQLVLAEAPLHLVGA
jgi:hypothetical protein